jgi:hypothetical protein
MILVIISVILAGGIWYMQGMGTSPQLATVPAAEQPAVNEQNSIVAQEPAPTGKADDILASFDEEGSQDAAVVEAGDANAEAVLSDGSAIIDLSQTYDETQL